MTNGRHILSVVRLPISPSALIQLAYDYSLEADDSYGSIHIFWFNLS